MSVRESRAGDDFHLLWAARRAMDLLAPSTELQLVRLEGPSPVDAPEEDDAFLGCDLTEYFGGESFETAHRTCFSQLKYSTKHPRRPWTVARLAAKPTQGKPVIFRLAEMFKAISASHSIDAAVTRLSVQLVSNQPLDAELSTVLKVVADVLACERAPRWRDIEAQLTNARTTSLKKLQRSSTLTDAKFFAFLRVLDLTGCGAESRLLQTLHLKRSIGSVLLDAPTQGVTGLLHLIREQTLPEQERSIGLTKEDILVALSAQGMASIFPYPPLLEGPSTRIPTGQSATLATAVVQSQNRRLVAHGGLGIGKTTTLLSLEKHLPPESVVVIFDCYARGQYDHSDQNRHSPGALIQIANELAQRLGLAPVLLPTSPVAPQVLRDALARVLAAASEVMGPEALCVVAIDAADNSASIANKRNEPCFLDVLWHLPVPDNIRLLLTSRTARVPEVLARADAKEGYDDVVLAGFDEAASAAMLRSAFPEAPDDACESFHRDSSGVARIQRYALDSSVGANMEAALAAAKSSLEKLFDDLVQTVSGSVPGAGSPDQLLAMLSVAPKPVDAALLVAASGQRETEIRRILDGLHPAVLPVAEGFGFADEDFETYLHSRTDQESAIAAHARFVAYLFPRRHLDREAAVRIAGHLEGANEVAPLVAMARDEGPPEVISDGFVRQAVYRTRVRLALRRLLAQSDESGRIEALQLLLAAADVSTSRDALTDTIKQAPDLAALHGDAASVAEVLASDQSESWRGAAHMRAASVLARHPEHRERAEEHLKLAQAWLRAWMSSSERDRGSFGPEDIAAAGFAQWLLSGHSSERTMADGWRPARFAIPTYESLLSQIAEEATWNELHTFLDRRRLSGTLRAQAVVAFRRRGGRVPKPALTGLLERLSQSSSRANGTWLVPLCEAAIEAGVAERTIRAALQPRTPRLSHISEWDAVERLSPYLEVQLLLRGTRRSSPSLDDLIPPAFQSQDHGNEARIFAQVGKRLLPLLEASLALSRSSTRRSGQEAQVRAAVAAAQRALAGPEGSEDADARRLTTFDAIARRALALLAKTRRLAESWGLNELVVELDQETRRASASLTANSNAAAGLLVKLALDLSRQDTAGPLVLHLVEEAARHCEESAIPAADKRDILLRASDTAARLRDSGALAHSEDLFKRALVQASSIDFDLTSRLRALSELVINAPRSALPVGDRKLAKQLVSAVVDAVPRVEDEGALPYRSALSAATRLDARVGLATAARWADEQRTSLKSGLRCALSECVKSEALTLSQAISLHGLMPPEDEIVEDVVALVRRAPDHSTRRTALHRWQRLLRRRACVDALGRGSVAEAERLVHALQEFAPGDPEVISSLTAFIASRPESSSHRRQDEEALHWDDAQSDQFRQRIQDATQERLEVDLTEMSESYLPRGGKVAYLKQVCARQEGGKVATLQRLADLTRNDRLGIQPEIVAEVLGFALLQWASSPGVQSWTLTVLPSWIAEHMPALFRTHYGDRGQIERRFDPVSPRDELREAVLKSAATQLDQLGTEELRALARYVGQGMNATEVFAAVHWALGSTPEPQRDAPSHASANEDLVVRLLIEMLGSEDARQRWLACHTIRNTVQTEGSTIVAELLHAAFLEPAPQDAEFRMPGTHQSPMTVKLWLLIALEGVAHANASVMAPHVSVLTSIASDTSFPHVAIRELARRILLAIPTLRPHEQEILLLSNRPSAYAVSTGRDVSDYSEVDTRFKFRAWDTYRYVYRPLAERLENIGLDDIATRADNWISDVWKASWDLECNADPRRRRRQDEYRLTSNDHGTMPVIETAQQYYEFHALMCTAGQLIDDGVRAQRRFDSDSTDPWESWIEEYLPRVPWPGDVRQEIPTAALHWTSEAAIEPPRDLVVADSHEDHSPQAELEPLARDTALTAFTRLDGLAASEAVVIADANISYTRESGYGWVAQSSAVATPEAIRALVSIFPSARGSLQIPQYGDDATDHWSDATDLPGFSFLGWLTEQRDQSTSLSDSDPYRGDSPGLQLITVDPTFTRAVAAAQLTQWRTMNSREPERREVDDLHGHLLAVPRAELLEDLRMRNRCLVLVAHSRVSRTRRQTQEPTLFLEGERLTVLWPNGSEEVTYGRLNASFSRF